MLTIHLRGITFEGKHGCTREEKFRYQPIVVDVFVEAAVLPAVLTDAPSDTIDWTPLREIVRRVVLGESRNSVERLAGDIADAILLSDVRARVVTVTVAKPEEWEDRNSVPGVTLRVKRKSLLHVYVQTVWRLLLRGQKS